MSRCTGSEMNQLAFRLVLLADDSPVLRSCPSSTGAAWWSSCSRRPGSATARDPCVSLRHHGFARAPTRPASACRSSAAPSATSAAARSGCASWASGSVPAGVSLPMHAHGMPGRLEHRRAQLGLPLPRLALRPAWPRARGAGGPRFGAARALRHGWTWTRLPWRAASQDDPPAAAGAAPGCDCDQRAFCWSAEPGKDFRRNPPGGRAGRSLPRRGRPLGRRLAAARLLSMVM